MKQLILASLLLALGGGAAYYMVNSKPVAEKKKPQPIIPLVEIQTLQPGQQQLTVSSRGGVTARTQGSLVPQVGGEIIAISDNYQNGGHFRKGEVLISIDPRDYQADVRIAESELAQAKVQYSEEQARSEQARKNWQRLGNRGQPNDLTLRKPQLARAQASVAAAEARLARAKLALERCEVKAPYDGVLQEKLQGLGQVVNRNQAVARILATDFAEIQLPVSQAELKALDLSVDPLNLKVSLWLAANEQTWQGVIKRQSAEINPQTRQISLIAEIEQPLDTAKHGARLDIGQYVNASIEGRSVQNVYRIPRSAVVRDQLIYQYVDDKLVETAIDIVWRQEQYVIATNTHNRRELTIVTNPPAFAYDQMPAKIEAQKVGELGTEASTTP